jgi:hypothetical protein
MDDPEEHSGQELERQKQKVGDHAAVASHKRGVLLEPEILLRAGARGAADRDSGQ